MKSRNVFDLIWNLGRRVVRLTGLVAILACTLSAPAYAVPVTVSFTVVDSFVKTGTSGPFGLAFNPITKTIWYSTGFESNVLREINQNLPGGPDTGALTLILFPLQ